MANGLRPGLRLKCDLIRPGTWTPTLKRGTVLTFEMIEKVRELGLEFAALSSVDRDRECSGMIAGDIAPPTPFLRPGEAERILEILVGRADPSEVRLITGECFRRLHVPNRPVDFRLTGPFERIHPINVFALSLAIGEGVGLGPTQLIGLGAGALLHDVGKALVPGNMVSKPGPLGLDERGLMRKHPALGAALLSNTPRFAKWRLTGDALDIVRYHHERLDGSGYPEQLRGYAIPRMASIVALADIFDAMLSDRLYAKRSPPGVAYQTIRAMADRQIEGSIVEAFLKRVLPYPPGTDVLLSDRRVGRVFKVDSATPLRPKVLVADEELDLATYRRLDIVSAWIPRKQKRHPIAMPARIRTGSGPAIWARTVDVSADGACLDLAVSPNQLPANFDLEFFVGGAFDTPVRARTCWIRPGGDGSMRVGVYVSSHNLRTVLSQTLQPGGRSA